MNEFLSQFRQRIEACWDDTTISPKSLPIDPTKPRSLGQCAPTSQVLIDELRAHFPESNFTLSIGEVRVGDVLLIDYHVWVVELADSPKDNMVIDVTADQSLALPSTIYDSIRNLRANGVEYLCYAQSHSKRFVKSEAIERYEILKAKYKEGV